MMTPSLLNIKATGPTAPAPPPGGASGVGVFDLLLPIIGPVEPRHEAAPDGKRIGKELPVEATETPNPLAWLIPPAPVVESLPAQHGEDRPIAAPIAPALSPPLPELSDAAVTVAPPVAPTLSRPDPATVADEPSPMPVIAPAASRSLPVLAGEAPTALSPPVLPARSSPIGAPPELVAATQPSLVAIAPPKSSGATSTQGTRDLPVPADRAGLGVTPEIRPALTVPRIAPAARLFAEAIHRAVRDDRGPATLDAAGFAAASDVKSHAVAATADVQHGALDLRQEHWPARMIERIDALRDAANAGDTSIRLIPDALGKIDVSLKRDGDTVAVQFTAQQAETRQLLADAAPKLAELAEARGLKLAQNGGDATGQQQQRQQPTTPIADAPRSARVDDTESTDTRIA